MKSFSFDFDAPQYLFLLLLLPLFWYIGRRSLATFDSWRRRASLLFRVAIATLVIVALAEPNWLTLIDRLTVLFVVDASDSIEPRELAHALDYVNSATSQKNRERGDRAGLLVFGRDASVEVPPLDHDWTLAKVESHYDPRSTNLESALELARATFPTQSGKRVVIVSDGNENVGQALPQAAALHEAGIGIDCVPIIYSRKGDVSVEKVSVPADVRRGTPFQLQIVLNNVSNERTIPGKLRIVRKLGGAEHLIAEEPLDLSPGKKVVGLPQKIEESGISTYEARFVPDHATDDVHVENNVATGFCRVGGKGHILLIEDAELPGRFDDLVKLLRKNEIEVTVRDSRRPFDDLADLQQFDSVILADVARVTGDGATELTQISESQIHALVQNTEHFGSGLIVLGGPNSFGAGGWRKTELEKALPVDFEIDNAKVDAVGALVLVIDSSGSMVGEKIAWSKAAAVAAANMLGKRDFLGVVTFDSEAHWVVPMRRNDEAFQPKTRINRINSAGGTDLMPALEQAYRAIQGVEASLKHVIVLTDGQTPKSNYASLVSSMNKRGITTTGVAVGPDADRMLLSDIGRRGGGKFYQVLSPKAIPRIFMREARRVAMPLIFEDRNGIAIQANTSSELMTGIDAPPPTTGYVLTTLKEDPLVEVALSTPCGLSANCTILATWQYGLGRSAALTTDIGERWSTAWPNWDNYEKLMVQLVRWSMRNHDFDDRLAITTAPRDGAIDIVVNALDREEDPVNMLSLSGTAVLPNGQSKPFNLNQVGPGRYTAKFDASEPGNYFLSISGGGRSAPLRSAVSVTSTAELNNLDSYEGFLAQMAEGKPTGGQPGRMIQAAGGIADTRGLLQTDVFRPGVQAAKSRNPVWPIVLFIASVAFFGDVFCRRVLISFEWLPRTLQSIFSRSNTTATRDEPRMARLRKSKQGATSRYVGAAETAGRPLDLEADALAPPSPETDPKLTPAVPMKTEAVAPGSDEPQIETRDVEPSDFTSRLLEAKKRARDEQNRP